MKFVRLTVKIFSCINFPFQNIFNCIIIVFEIKRSYHGNFFEMIGENMKDFLNLLKNMDLFKHFSCEELENLFTSDSYKIKKYCKSSIIYVQNEECTSLDIILKGTIVVQKIDSNGNVLTVSDFSTNDILGGNLLFSKKNRYPMTMVSKNDSIVLHIKKDLILQLCQTNTNFLEAFLELLSDTTLVLTERIKSLTMKTVRQSIAEFLLFEYYSHKSKIIKLNISKKDLAEKIGIQRTSLSRELNKMRKDGFIEYDSKSITINDVEILKELHINT